MIDSIKRLFTPTSSGTDNSKTGRECDHDWEDVTTNHPYSVSLKSDKNGEELFAEVELESKKKCKKCGSTESSLEIKEKVIESETVAKYHF
jgi:hypothetical protein